MIASARFLFLLVVLTLIGCSPSEKPDTKPDSDKSPKSSSNTTPEKKQGNASVSEQGVASAEKRELKPAPTLDLEKEFSGDLFQSRQSQPDQASSNPSEPGASMFLKNDVDSSAYNILKDPISTDLLPTSSASSETSLSELAYLTKTPLAPDTQATPSNPLRNEGDPLDTNVQPQDNRLRTQGQAGETVPAESTSGEANTLPANSKLSTKGKPNSKGEPFDPIKENGPIFVDWPQPELVLVMTGRQNGYIEPCGCAGLERMRGGLTRRDSLIQDLIKRRKWPVVAVDIGNQVKGHKRQPELKFQHTAESLTTMGYSGVGLGIADLQLPAGELAAVTSNEKSPFVSANIDLIFPDSQLIKKFRIVERNNIKIGITAVLGNSFRKQINNKSFPTTDPFSAIEQIAEPLKKCEVRVLLAYANEEESIALAKRFPMFNVIVTADGGSDPPKVSKVIEGTNTYLVEVGEKGDSVVVLGIYRDKKIPVRYQRVPLDSRFATSKRIHRLMSAYQEQLKILGLKDLKIKPVPCPEARTKGKYTGSKACATCHEASYDIWRKSKHAKAWQTLVEADPPRNYDPECISCHVVGWDPQRYYPFVGGFMSSKKTPELENVGCESCHGPGGAHAKAEEGSDLDLQERLQKAMVVTLEESRSNPQKMCYNCHDLDNSPEFNFDKYWPEVKHYETDSGEKEDDDE